MIPTREQIEKWKQDRSSCVSEVWLRAMRDEIDRLTAELGKPAAAVPDDTRELVAQLADLVAWAMPTMNHHKGVKAIAAKLRGGSTVPVEGTSDEILQLPRDDQRWELVAQLADVVASIWGRSDCIEGEAKAIAAKLRGGA